MAAASGSPAGGTPRSRASPPGCCSRRTSRRRRGGCRAAAAAAAALAVAVAARQPARSACGSRRRRARSPWRPSPSCSASGSERCGSPPSTAARCAGAAGERIAHRRHRHGVPRRELRRGPGPGRHAAGPGRRGRARAGRRPPRRGRRDGPRHAARPGRLPRRASSSAPEPRFELAADRIDAHRCGRAAASPGVLDRIRGRAEAALGDGLDPEQAALARGFVLGQDDRIDPLTARAVPPRRTQPPPRGLRSERDPARDPRRRRPGPVRRSACGRGWLITIAA